MQNPFPYGNIVGQDSFCNRKKELAELGRVRGNGGRAFVSSERRFGKTSLVKLVLASLPQHRYVTAYVGLWPKDGEASFVRALAMTRPPVVAPKLSSFLPHCKALAT